MQKTSFKKWNKGYHGIMDFILVNSCFAWNMSATLKGVFRTTIDNTKWRMYLAKQMLNWKDPMVECERTILLPVVSDNHFHKPVSNSANVHIAVQFDVKETSIQKSRGIQTADTCGRFSNHMATCINPNCDIIAHSLVSSTNRWLIFKNPHIIELSCFKIAHHGISMGLFSVTSKNSCIVNLWQQKSTKTSHRMCNMICSLYADINLKKSDR